MEKISLTTLEDDFREVLMTYDEIQSVSYSVKEGKGYFLCGLIEGGSIRITVERLKKGDHNHAG